MYRKLMILLAALLAAASLTACSSGGVSVDDDAAAAAAESSSPETTAADEPTEPEGPTVVPFGVPADVTAWGAEAGSVTVQKPTIEKREPGQWGAKPEHGVFWTFRVTYKATGDDTWSTNPFDWAIVDAEGQRYELAFVTEIGQPQLSALDLNAGEKNSGYVTIDAPKDAVRLVYAPVDENLAQWDLT